MTARLRQRDRFDATFQPKALDTLKPGAEEWIGRRARWDAMWTISEEDGGPYVGQFACGIREPHGFGTPAFVWVPEEDLTDIVIVDRLEEESASTATAESEEL